MIRKVFVSPVAEAQIEVIDAWWRANRLDSPDLFKAELEEAREKLGRSPEIGRTYSLPAVRGTRRLLLRATRFHIYYVRLGEDVRIVSVWSAVRGVGPDLAGAM